MPVVGARGSASEFSPAQPPLRSSVCPAAPGTPLPALPAALSRRAGARTRAPSFPAPAPTHGVGLPKSNAEAPPGKEVRLPLHAALLQSGIGRKWLEHPPRAFAVSLRFAEGKQLPPKSCHPLPSRKTRAGAAVSFTSPCLQSPYSRLHFSRSGAPRKARSHPFTWAKP
uniref:Uncharacterized protein n=1 Tax=Mustela putorius furo TaxID=9669 RepID=M3YRN3_MUSPF